MISLAQNREEVLIDWVFLKATGSFIDVGAGHPLCDSVTKYFNLALRQQPNGLTFSPASSVKLKP